MKTFAALVCFSVFLTSCESTKVVPTQKVVPARLYDLSSAEVFNATFFFSGTTQGKVSFSLPSGEQLEGEYQTITGGSSVWGNVYSTVWGAAGSTSLRSQVSAQSNPKEYIGSAIATSKEGRVIECEYVTNTSRTEPHGQGACRDNRGKKYKLMF